jgi:hypothetical protein
MINLELMTTLWEAIPILTKVQKEDKRSKTDRRKDWDEKAKHHKAT